jgi:hypothetical protein
MLQANPLDPPPVLLEHDSLRLGWCDLLVRLRPLVWAGIVLLHVLSFNGIWRVGVDSALYRGIGESLARGEGYRFVGQPNELAYPGVPLLVAGSEWVFGHSVLPVLVLMSVCSIVGLWYAEKLLKLHFAPWVALAVVLAIALNGRYLLSSTELMTDTPFFLATMVCLWGWERYRLSMSRVSSAVAIAHMIAGLLLAVCMRPTFWVLAVAFVLYCAWQLVKPRGLKTRRSLFLVGLVAVGLIVATLAAVNPGNASKLLLGGEYGAEFVDRLGNLQKWLAPQVTQVFKRDLPNLFMGQTMGPAGWWISGVLILGVLIVGRRHLLWTLMVLVLLGVCLIASSVPRYFLFVLPVLWVGWIGVWMTIVTRLPRSMQGPTLWVVVMVPVFLSFGHTANLIVEQRKPDLVWLRDRSDRQQTFNKTYLDGLIPKLHTVADLVKQHTKPGQKVVAPHGNIVSYFSGLPVIGDREMLMRVPEVRHPQVARDFGVDFWILPRDLYQNDEKIRAMMQRRLIKQTSIVAERDDIKLIRADVYVPPGNWLEQPVRRKPNP